MKNIASSALIILLAVVFLCACSNADSGEAGRSQTAESKDEPSLNDTLISQSIELTRTMDALAQSDGYIALLSAPGELTEIVDEISAGDYASPQMAVLITVPDTTVAAILTAHAGELRLPDDAYDVAVSRICAAFPNMLTARQGASALAATSMLSANKSFRRHTDFTGNVYVVLLYESYGSITLYRAAMEDVVTASASFLFPDDELREAITTEALGDSLQDLIQFAESGDTDIDLSGITIEYVDGEI